MDEHPISCHQLARMYQMDGRQLHQQYKNHISDYKDWDQREHATEWMLFEKNMDTHLSIDETALSNDELYTVVTNKGAKGNKGAIVHRSIETHYEGILNYLNNRSTNASAESFNAKIQAFRSSARGLRDINFFLFRLQEIYA